MSAVMTMKDASQEVLTHAALPATYNPTEVGATPVGLQLSLANCASKASKTLDKLLGAMDFLEDELFDRDTLARMDVGQKLMLNREAKDSLKTRLDVVKYATENIDYQKLQADVVGLMPTTQKQSIMSSLHNESDRTQVKMEIKSSLNMEWQMGKTNRIVTTTTHEEVPNE